MRLILIGLAAVTLATAQNSRSFHLTQNETADQMNQIATLIRSTGEIQQIWADDLQRTVSVTGTSAQLDMAAWYVKQLDRSTPPPSPQDYQAGSDDTVRMFFLPNPSRERLNKAATQVRTTARVKRLFAYGTLGALVVRGTPEQLATAEKVIEEMRTSQ